MSLTPEEMAKADVPEGFILTPANLFIPDPAYWFEYNGCAWRFDHSYPKPYLCCLPLHADGNVFPEEACEADTDFMDEDEAAECEDIIRELKNLGLKEIFPCSYCDGTAARHEVGCRNNNEATCPDGCGPCVHGEVSCLCLEDHNG